jgi:polysaccharide biosynthesis protein VpsQ
MVNLLYRGGYVQIVIKIKKLNFIIIRVLLISLPLLYMAFIWLQSSYFNPESLLSLSTNLNMSIILTLGLILELAHFFEFGLLYLFLILALISIGRLTEKNEYKALIFSLLFGLSDEIHQFFVPFRSASLGDLLKNTIGIIIVWRIIHKSYFKLGNSKLAGLLKKIQPNSFER